MKMKFLEKAAIAGAGAFAAGYVASLVAPSLPASVTTGTTGQILAAVLGGMGAVAALHLFHKG
jgi:hypothetical protein